MPGHPMRGEPIPILCITMEPQRARRSSFSPSSTVAHIVRTLPLVPTMFLRAVCGLLDTPWLWLNQNGLPQPKISPLRRKHPG